jgi:hypothetical protein
VSSPFYFVLLRPSPLVFEILLVIEGQERRATRTRNLTLLCSPSPPPLFFLYVVSFSGVVKGMLRLLWGPPLLFDHVQRIGLERSADLSHRSSQHPKNRGGRLFSRVLHCDIGKPSSVPPSPQKSDLHHYRRRTSIRVDCAAFRQPHCLSE